MKTRITPIPTYEADGNIIQFRPVDDIPGFSHRVIINRGSYFGYLGTHCRPSIHAAEYFLDKWYEEMRDHRID